METELKNKEIALDLSSSLSPFEGKGMFALLESEKNLPLLDLKEEGSGVFSFHLLAFFRDYGGEFFYEMIYRWLFPTAFPLLCGADFRNEGSFD
ncbi:MAG: hypothetical protein HYZ47_03510 [Simkania negevensis]|nr:hypothetical protein [Simkania negevensis]